MIIALWAAVKIWTQFFVSSVRTALNKLFIQFRNKIMERDDVLTKIRELKAMIGRSSRVDEDGDTIESKAEQNVVEPKQRMKKTVSELPKPKKAVRLVEEHPKLIVEDSESEKVEVKASKPKKVDARSEEKKALDKERMAKLRAMRKSKTEGPKVESPKVESPKVENKKVRTKKVDDTKVEKEKKPRKPRVSKKVEEDSDDKEASKYVRPI